MAVGTLRPLRSFCAWSSTYRTTRSSRVRPSRTSGMPGYRVMRHSSGMKAISIGNWVWRGVAVVATVLAVVLALRVLQSERQPDLKPWHTWAPHEADAGDIDSLDWNAWLRREDE